MSLVAFFTGLKKLHQPNAPFFLRKLCCHLTVSLQLIPRISLTCAGNLASRPKRGKNYVGRFISKFPSDRESRENRSNLNPNGFGTFSKRFFSVGKEWIFLAALQTGMERQFIISCRSDKNLTLSDKKVASLKWFDKSLVKNVWSETGLKYWFSCSN